MSVTLETSNSINVGQLQNELQDNNLLQPDIISITRNTTSLSFTFTQELTEDEEIILEGILLTHVPKVSLGIIDKTYTIGNLPARNHWTLVNTYFYNGTRNEREIINIIVDSYKSVDITSYSIRIVDLTNANVICTRTFSNDVPNTNLLGIISNLPKTRSILELQYKTTGGNSADKINISDMIFYV